MPADRSGNVARCGGGSVVLAAGLCTCLAATPATGAEPCTVSNLTHRSADIACSVSAGGTGRARVHVLLEGFHDDSSASVALRAGGNTLACFPDDRAARSGEDGDQGEVRLTCGFDLEKLRDGTLEIEGRVEFNHAEFVGAHWTPAPSGKP